MVHPLRIVSLIVALTGITFSLAGCAAWQTARGSEQQDRVRRDHQRPKPPVEESTAVRREAREGTAKPAMPQISEPPESTLAYDGRTVTGEIGSYCWSSAGLPPTCADTAGIPVAHEQQMLTVPTGSMLMFDYGGRRRPDSVEAGAYPLEQEQRWLDGADGTRLMRPRWGRSALAMQDLGVRREGDRTHIRAELSPGEYAIEVSVLVPKGDASYYFRVAVGGKAGKIPAIARRAAPDTDLTCFCSHPFQAPW